MKGRSPSATLPHRSARSSARRARTAASPGRWCRPASSACRDHHSDRRWHDPRAGERCATDPRGRRSRSGCACPVTNSRSPARGHRDPTRSRRRAIRSPARCAARRRTAHRAPRSGRDAAPRSPDHRRRGPRPRAASLARRHASGNRVVPSRSPRGRSTGSPPEGCPATGAPHGRHGPRSRCATGSGSTAPGRRTAAAASPR